VVAIGQLHKAAVVVPFGFASTDGMNGGWYKRPNFVDNALDYNLQSPREGAVGTVDNALDCTGTADYNLQSPREGAVGTVDNALDCTGTADYNLQSPREGAVGTVGSGERVVGTGTGSDERVVGTVDSGSPLVVVVVGTAAFLEPCCLCSPITVQRVKFRIASLGRR
jgi:hypothetical protein